MLILLKQLRFHKYLHNNTNAIFTLLIIVVIVEFVNLFVLKIIYQCSLKFDID